MHYTFSNIILAQEKFCTEQWKQKTAVKGNVHLFLVFFIAIWRFYCLFTVKGEINASLSGRLDAGGNRDTFETVKDQGAVCCRKITTFWLTFASILSFSFAQRIIFVFSPVR